MRRDSRSTRKSPALRPARRESGEVKVEARSIPDVGGLFLRGSSQNRADDSTGIRNRVEQGTLLSLAGRISAYNRATEAVGGAALGESSETRHRQN